ncbi:MAG: ATP-binding protein [Lysobacteraceae bacterium]
MPAPSLERHLDRLLLRTLRWPLVALLVLIGVALFASALRDHQRRLDTLAHAHGGIAQARIEHRLASHARLLADFDQPDCVDQDCAVLFDAALRLEPSTLALRLLDGARATRAQWRASHMGAATPSSSVLIDADAFAQARRDRRARMSFLHDGEAGGRLLLTVPALDPQGGFAGALEIELPASLLFADPGSDRLPRLAGDELRILDGDGHVAPVLPAARFPLADGALPQGWAVSGRMALPSGWQVWARRPAWLIGRDILPALGWLALALIALGALIGRAARRVGIDVATPINQLADACATQDGAQPSPPGAPPSPFEETNQLQSAVEQVLLRAGRRLEQEQQNGRALESANQRLSEQLDANDGYLEMQTQRLQDAMAAAWQAAETKNRVLTNTSHEIRTPLNGIIGATELLLRSQPLADAQRDLLQRQLDAAQALLVLVDDILHLGRASSGLVLRPAGFDILAEARRVRDALRSLADERGLALTVQAAADFHAFREGDQARIRQILIGLVGNALKFTAQGGVDVHLQEIDADRLRLRVSDTGIGIPADQLSRVFEPFYQVQGNTDREYGGTGLGLAIVAEIVRAMDGRITVESAPGNGTTFDIELPLPRAQAPQRAVDTDPPPLAALPADALRALVVDDLALNRELLVMQATALGVPAQAADSGVAALQCLADDPSINLLLLDCQMPGMDGYAASRAIRERWPQRALTIIAVTAHARADELQRCLHAGMDDYLAKPVTLAALRDILARHAGDPA